jgi:hypothetical protein
VFVRPSLPRLPILPQRHAERRLGIGTLSPVGGVVRKWSQEGAVIRDRAFAAMEHAGGAVTAAATAAVIHAVIDPHWDMVLAMVVGTAIGVAIHILAAVALGPFVGMFPAMASGSLIGMYGGMLFAMRDSMQAASWFQSLTVAVIFGVCVVAVVQLYDRALRGASIAEGDSAGRP